MSKHKRSAFEAWAKDQGFPLDRSDTAGCEEDYEDLRTTTAWEGFCIGVKIEQEQTDRLRSALKQIADDVCDNAYTRAARLALTPNSEVSWGHSSPIVLQSSELQRETRDDREKWVLVPLILPNEVLGRAAMAGVFETGNPKHGWDYLLLHVGSRAHPLHPAAFKAEELIGRLMSKNLTHEDCEAVAILLRQLTATVTPNL